MKKRPALFFGILSFLLLLSGCSANNKLPTIVWLENVMQKIGIGPTAVAGDQSIALFMKFLIFLLVFAIVYFGVSKLLNKKDDGFGEKRSNKIAVTISVVISLMGSLMIPNSFIVQLYQQYSMVFALFLAAAPLIAGLAIYFELVKKEPNAGEEGLSKRTQHIIGLIIFIILASVYGGLSNYLFSVGKNSGLANHKTFYEWAMFATSWLQLCIVYFFGALIYDVFASKKSSSGTSSSSSSPSSPSDLSDLDDSASDSPRPNSSSSSTSSPISPSSSSTRGMHPDTLDESETLSPEETKISVKVLNNAEKFVKTVKLIAKANIRYITRFKSNLTLIENLTKSLITDLSKVRQGEEQQLKNKFEVLQTQIHNSNNELKKVHALVERVHSRGFARILIFKNLIDTELDLLGSKKRLFFGARGKFDSSFKQFSDLENTFRVNFINPHTSNLTRLIIFFGRDNSALNQINTSLTQVYSLVSGGTSEGGSIDKLRAAGLNLTGQLAQIENVVKGTTGINAGEIESKQLVKVSEKIEKQLFKLLNL